MSNCMCMQECYRVVTQWESYTVDGPISPPTPIGLVTHPCQPLTDQEAADQVSQVVVANKYSVQEPCCPDGCICIPYEPALPPRRLAPRNVKLCIPVLIPNGPSGFCVYSVCFTVHIQETVFPVGFCRPDLSPQPKAPPPPKIEPPPRQFEIPQPPGEGIAPVTGESKTTRK